MRRYVVGFVFSGDEQQVILLQKRRPEWQRGLMNGMGGHVEEGEKFYDAMVREGLEESGVEPADGWELFAIVEGPYHGSGHDRFEMYCYRSSEDGLIYRVARENDVGEHFLICETRLVSTANIVPNLRWLIPMALGPSKDWPLHITESYRRSP